MICREKYLNELIKAKNNGFPKVITGIRRCGKSYLLNYIYREHLLSSGVKSENIIYLDLTKVSNAYYRDPLYLYEHIVGITQKSTEINYFLIIGGITIVAGFLLWIASKRIKALQIGLSE